MDNHMITKLCQHFYGLMFAEADSHFAPPVLFSHLKIPYWTCLLQLSSTLLYLTVTHRNRKPMVALA